MSTIDVEEDELATLVGEVLERLARDPSASHLWQWRERPGCDDEPYGRGRRNYLGALLGLLGAAAAPGLAGCGGGPNLESGAPPTPQRSNRTGAPPEPPAEAHGEAPTPPAQAPQIAEDAGVSSAEEPGDAGDTPRPRPRPIHRPPPCADDPCACADDPCAM